MIPQDSAVEHAVRQQKVVSISEPNSKAAKAFDVLTANLLQGAGEDTMPRRGLAQLFTSLFNRKG